MLRQPRCIGQGAGTTDIVLEQGIELFTKSRITFGLFILCFELVKGGDKGFGYISAAEIPETAR